ncbi:MAG TPA: PilN domain-containing protein [Chitinispirillaceae bacterium]|nr:PilN domain-containing protein [Chitinispirillaceae bacterium]
MNTFHGITAVSDGTYVYVSAVKTKSGWKLTKKSRWQIGDLLRNSLLFTKYLNLGIECKWIRTLSEDSTHLVTSLESSSLSPCIHQSQLTLHMQLLDKNLNQCYPDDAYLCTIPLHLSTPSSPDSFITIFKDDNLLKIGIICNKKLSAVFSLPALMFGQLSGYLERIRRYWKEKTNAVFPSHVFILNNQDIHPGEQFSLRSIQIPASDPAEIKAFGVALCSLDKVVPSLYGPAKAGRYRFIRTAVYAFSAILVLCGLISSGYVYYDQYKSKQSLHSCEIEYKNILNNNNEIRTLSASGESLAKKIIRIQKFGATPTYWNRFLELIGSVRPKTLYFERFASEQLTENSNAVKIALAGWADSETTVTDFIQKLNKPDYVSNVSLSTLERDNKLNKVRFKVICSVTLSGN